MDLAPTNWLAVIAGTAIYMIVGMIWYSPKVFGKLWMSKTGITEESCCPSAMTFILAVINAFIGVFVLSQFIHHINDVDTAADGACVAIWAWAGFVATTHFSAVIWEKRPLSLFFIHIGCLLVSMTAAGALLAVWK